MKNLRLVLLILFSYSAFADGTWTNGQQVITNIIWRPNYHGFYVAGGTYHDPQGCSGSTANTLYVFDAATEADSQTMDRLFTLLTTALVTEKRVHVFVDGCRGVLPVVTGLQLNK